MEFQIRARVAVAACAVTFSFGTSHAQQPSQGHPGPEHERLAALAGAWTVEAIDAQGRPVSPPGTATAVARIGGRFLEVEADLERGPLTHAVYTFGFDRRHGQYTVIAMDASGTYFVTAKGTPDASGSRVAMYGTDDDPTMTALGYVKEFVIVLDVRGSDRFDVETRFIDNRTPERKELTFITLRFTRRS